MIKIYKLNNQVAGWIDLAKSEFDTLANAIQQDGSFTLDITLADNETLINIDCVNETAEVYVIPEPPPGPTAQQNKATAQSKLASTDWVNQPDVYDPSLNPHLLNRDEYLQYRSQVRAVAVNPTSGPINWPTEPTPQWSQSSQ
jgi:hypothetical protein